MGWVVTHAQTLLIPDAYEDARFYKEADQQTGFRTRSVLCAPLMRDGEVIGVLQILNPRDKKSFDEQELEGFTAYANLTATAMKSYAALERMRAQERVERDLAIACDIQRELLARAIPSASPARSLPLIIRPLPTWAAISITCSCVVPTKHTSRSAMSLAKASRPPF